jgi:hypothetical protein
LTYEGLTLASEHETPLLQGLSVSIPFGTRVLVTGAVNAPGAALFKATVGIPIPGSGRIVRPDDVMFFAPAPLPAVKYAASNAGAPSDRTRPRMTRSVGCSTSLISKGSSLTQAGWITSKIGNGYCRSANSSFWRWPAFFWQPRGSSFWTASR